MLYAIAMGQIKRLGNENINS